jgi:large subunit ribosomal protein L20|tara:strand:+ start:130 stop:495 length:366 start_codon:yes stop_codon:yes gene_type:complete
VARVKRGVTKQKRHSKVLKLTKGHKAGRHRLYKRAHESLVHALSYAYAHRRERKGDFRRLWITRINAATKINGVSYSRFINMCKIAEFDVDRKVLAEIAVSDPKTFAAIVDHVSTVSSKAS